LGGRRARRAERLEAAALDGPLRAYSATLDEPFAARSGQRADSAAAGGGDVPGTTTRGAGPGLDGDFRPAGGLFVWLAAGGTRRKTGSCEKIAAAAGGSLGQVLTEPQGRRVHRWDV